MKNGSKGHELQRDAKQLQRHINSPPENCKKQSIHNTLNNRKHPKTDITITKGF